MNLPYVDYIVMYGDEEGNDAFIEPTNDIIKALKKAKEIRGVVLKRTTERFDVESYKKDILSKFDYLTGIKNELSAI